MEINLLLEVAKQAPALAILSFLVFYLVKTLSRQQKILLDQLQVTKEESSHIIQKNSQVIGSATTVMEDTRNSLDELKLELVRSNGRTLKEN